MGPKRAGGVDNMDIKKEYERWLANATADADVAAELKTLDDTKIEDAFYRDLAFGTGGLRGVIGAGTNRMNIYTVAKASQGLADYLKKNFADFSHVKDVVRAYRMIVESDNCNQIYNVGSGNAYSLEDMLTYIIGLSNQNIEIEVDQNRIRPTDQPVICCDRSLIGKELGWEPQYNVYDALREMYECYRNGGEN